MGIIIRITAATALLAFLAAPLAISQEHTTEECYGLASLAREIALARDEGIPLASVLDRLHREEGLTEIERRAYATILVGIYNEWGHLVPEEIFSVNYTLCLRRQ